MADYTSTPVDIGTGPAGTDGDTTRGAAAKIIADFAQIFAGLTFDSTTNILGIGRSPIAGKSLVVDDNMAVVADGGSANSQITSYGGTAGLGLQTANGTETTPTATLISEAIGRISARGYDGAGFDNDGFQITFVATEAWDATSHGQQMVFKTADDGSTTLDARMTLEQDGGLFMAGATGSSQGVGTINAVGVYDDGVILTDYVFEYYVDGKAVDDNERTRAFDTAWFDIDYFSEIWKAEKALPNMPTREEFKDQRLSVGDLAQRLWEVVEVQAAHISMLNERLKKIEG